MKGRNVLYLISSYPPKMINEYERQQKDRWTQKPPAAYDEQSAVLRGNILL